MDKVLFIYNPQSGHLQIKPYLWDILNLFSAAYADLRVKATQSPTDAYHMVKDLGEKVDTIICAGGDGTLNNVMNGLMELPEEKRPLIGYIPAGSTNDFGNSLKLSRNMRRAAEFCLQGEPKPYDLGKFNENYFVYIAAFGLLSEVSYETDQQMKNILGHFAYVLEGVRSLSSIEPYHLRITTDDAVREGEYIYGMITNTLSVGGIYKMSEEDVDLSDGQFEVLLVRNPKNLADLTSISNFLLDIDDTSDTVETFKTNHITIEAEERMKWTLDGEDGGAPEKVEISVIHNAAKIIS